jgi:hypothetical protein
VIVTRMFMRLVTVNTISKTRVPTIPSAIVRTADQSASLRPPPTSRRSPTRPTKLAG